MESTCIWLMTVSFLSSLVGGAAMSITSMSQDSSDSYEAANSTNQALAPASWKTINGGVASVGCSCTVSMYEHYLSSGYGCQGSNTGTVISYSTVGAWINVMPGISSLVLSGSCTMITNANLDYTYTPGAYCHPLPTGNDNIGSVLLSCAGTPSPTPYPTPYPTAFPTPFPTPSPTPSPTPYPTPYPTAFPTPFPTPSPTPSPTPYPTPYPTAYPTPFPTPSPTPSAGGVGGSVAATGDPHLQNVLGQRFDLMKPGKHVLISIPRGRHKNALLRVEADARQVGGQCADMYFQELNVTGEWVQATGSSGLNFKAQGVHDEQPKWLKFGKVQVKVAHGRTLNGDWYLNFYVKHLGYSGYAVGGLLGEDDHTEAAMPSEACVHYASLFKVLPDSSQSAPVFSVAEASFA
ncbi:unnamed protein product [Prorocentrum cordatum]|uniref:Uncharacterized protein n=1 Tax=Prorocentrum cordatum TaxID=2364126 RepID=A0ABN9SWM4_9DINO|nr:unnamed protein product [Polarella glacialis]